MDSTNDTRSVEAEPTPFTFGRDDTAVLIIDMQRDFLEDGGFGDSLGNDVSKLRAAVEPTRTVLRSAREAGLPVIYTREGHEPNLSDCPPTKRDRGEVDPRIGEHGPMGRVLVRGEPGHEIVPELEPREGETVIDKPGKGSFYATDLDLTLRNMGVENLVVTGVTTEVCVHSTIREANDRGYECLLLEDCVASYFETFQAAGVEMVKAQGGIFGWVSDAERFCQELDE